jgi:Na+/melibiose symporter-like transporter
MSDTHFYLYVGCLVVAGLFLLASALTGLIGAKVLERILAGLGGLAALGYGVYLFFIFDGGTVHEYFYVYILAVVIPILVIYRAVKTVRERRATPPPSPAPYQSQAPQNPVQPH